jgi:hypothetical protein
MSLESERHRKVLAQQFAMRDLAFTRGSAFAIACSPSAVNGR